LQKLVTALVVDDQEIVRKGICAMLESMKRIQVVGEAENGMVALACIEALHPDIVLLDLKMPEMDGLETLRALRAKDSDIRVLVLSMFAEDAYVLEARKLGANGYISKDVGVNTLFRAIDRIMAGEEFFPEMKIILDHSKPPANAESIEKIRMAWSKLTDRERQIALLAGEGLMNKEIADKLDISVRTVEVHVFNFMKKLELRNRAEIIRFILDHRFILSPKKSKLD
jgi:DNA-binding NarL/FixJ family response regulator